jgi:hypothetical protein
MIGSDDIIILFMVLPINFAIRSIGEFKIRTRFNMMMAILAISATVNGHTLLLLFSFTLPFPARTSVSTPAATAAAADSLL